MFSGCRKKTDTTKNLYIVKYYAAWRGFEPATCHYHWLTCKFDDSRFFFGPFDLKTDGVKVFEFNTKLHYTLKISFLSYHPYGSTHSDTIQIYYNGKLVQSARDSCIYIINQ